MQYSQYANEVPNIGDVTPTASSQTPPKAGQDDSVMTSGEQRVIGREERIEYRDQDGNLLDEAQISALESNGKVEFKTKYETRTRLVDADGNEVPGSDGLAPAHPDVEGQNPDTKGIKEDPQSQPANAAASVGSVNKENDGKAMPASDANEATK